MQRNYNFIYSKLVEKDSDLIGHIAYSLYKKSKIEYIETQMGTGGALTALKSKLKKTFIVVNINQPVTINLKTLLKFHRDHAPLATIATRSLRELQGIYVLEPKVFNQIPPGFCMLEDTVFHELTKQGKLLSYPILGEKI